MLDLFVVPLAAALCVGSATSPIADVFVDASATNCATGTGSAADPVCSITAALAIAAPGDTVRIAPGTYVENVVIPFDLELVGTSGAAVTVVDGGAVNLVIGSVVEIPVAVTVTIDGLTLTNGFASQGGGIFTQGDLTLRNSTIAANRSISFGGGISSYANLVVENSLIEGNRASSGGGIWSRCYNCADPTTTISDSTIRDNIASSDSYYGGFPVGGGLAQVRGSLTVLDTTIAGNGCFDGAPGSSSGGYPPAYAFGGGVWAESAVVSIAGSTISNNRVSAYPGDFGTAPGGGYGGGLRANQSLVQISNSTISGNVAYGVGGLDLEGPLAGSLLVNTTVTENRAEFDYISVNAVGGGLRISSGPFEVHNSVVADNYSVGLGTDVFGSLISLGYNLVGEGGTGITNGVNGDLAGTPMNPLDVLLGPLANNGGPTLTHALLLGSPAVNAGDPVSFEPFDQRGVARPVGALPDIGAYESDGTAPSLCNGDGGDQAGCTNCPCGNNSAIGTLGGCLNSAGASAFLLGTGNPSVTLPPMSADDLRFGLSGAPASTLCLLLSGDSIAPANPAAFCFGQDSGTQALAFDGLRCADLNLRRHGARTSNTQGQVGTTNSPWGGEGNPALGIAQAFGGFAAGDTRYFQVVYRDNPLAVCSRGLNTSQAVEVVFTR